MASATKLGIPTPGNVEKRVSGTSIAGWKLEIAGSTSVAVKFFEPGTMSRPIRNANSGSAERIVERRASSLAPDLRMQRR
jgi:hypothetical protein